MDTKVTRVSLIDDHKMLRKGIIELIDGFPGYQVVSESNNGREFQSLIAEGVSPDIVLLDIKMPEMDGYETAEWIAQNSPQIRILVLSMYDDEQSIIKMIKAGARGYVLKDSDPDELKRAFDEVMTKGYYHSELVSNIVINNLRNEPASQLKAHLNDRESEFLKLACTELTYKEIADKMCLAPRTIDGYREALFEKLSVKSRVGLVLFAIRNGLVKM